MSEKIWELKSLHTYRTALYFQTYWKFYTYHTTIFGIMCKFNSTMTCGMWAEIVGQ